MKLDAKMTSGQALKKKGDSPWTSNFMKANLK